MFFLNLVEEEDAKGEIRKENLQENFQVNLFQVREYMKVEELEIGFFKIICVCVFFGKFYIFRGVYVLV